jgi:hypothetical protein
MSKIIVITAYTHTDRWIERERETERDRERDRERQRDREREREREGERANMLCQGMTSTRSFDVGLRSGKVKKLEYIKSPTNSIMKLCYNKNIISQLCTKVMSVFIITQTLSLFILQCLFLKLILSIQKNLSDTVTAVEKVLPYPICGHCYY